MGLPVGKNDGLVGGAARPAAAVNGVVVSDPAELVAAVQPDKAAFKVFDVRDLLGKDHRPGIEGKIHLPDNVFDFKDPWAEELRTALGMVKPTGSLLEIGFGSGANLVYVLATQEGITKCFGSDLMGDVSLVGAGNVQRISGIGNDRFEHIPGNVDLMAGIGVWVEPGSLDWAVACIPQVGLADGIPQLADSAAHYFVKKPRAGYEGYDKWGLTLNVEALIQGREYMKPGGKFMLNLAGRVPVSVLKAMFRDTGYEPEVIHESVIPQHKDTCLKFFTQREADTDVAFQFYGTPCLSQDVLTATEARKALDGGKVVYHNLYQIVGTMKA